MIARSPTPSDGNNKTDTIETPWWCGATIYQIYPRSFLDTNNDGIGDLPGISQKLDYIASLNVDAIWLSPFFSSPMNDFGYDISDFRAVDPIFGTLADFDHLVAKAHECGLKVLIDQVYSHTSNQHAWFLESRKDRTNPKADWFVWADPKEDGAPPNNWQSVFNGPAWTWDGQRRQYYLHNFLTSQPDLNLHNPEVQNAILDTAKFWLDRGVDGFRLDVVNFYMHDPQLRDNPPATATKPENLARPFNYQQHLYNQSHPDIFSFLERLRGVTNSYKDVFTLGEVGGEAFLDIKAYIKDGKRLNSAYGFDFLYSNKITPGLVQNALKDWSERQDTSAKEPSPQTDDWPTWTFSNHDAPRVASRWSAQPAETPPLPPSGKAPLQPDNQKPNHNWAKLYGLLLTALRGNIILYQGEELGLPQGKVPFDKLQDPEAIANWPHTLGRDGARTPIPWCQDAANAGFSLAKTPWLPVDTRHQGLNVETQEHDNSSNLHFFRQILEIRAASPALKYGAITFLETPEGGLAFLRSYQNETLLCAFNLGAQTIAIDMITPPPQRIVINVDLPQTTPPTMLPAGTGFIASTGKAK